MRLKCTLRHQIGSGRTRGCPTVSRDPNEIWFRGANPRKIPLNFFKVPVPKLDWRLSHEKVEEDCSEEEKNPTYRESVKCKIFLGFSSSLISSGLRDIIRYLAQHHMVEVIVTEAGGIEEDLIKCLADTYRGEFSLPGAALRSEGLNRIGNLLVPDDNYCKFRDWINPILDQMLEEQKTKNVLWTPSKVIARLGKEINDKS
ncbi:putative deoxyhypusine synthase [Tanacetum coccineum]